MNVRLAPKPESPSVCGSLDVKFSDGRFLKRVLQEAARDRHGDDIVRRLEAMGFSSDIVQIALHAAGGDEQRALEICMSGLAFVGGAGQRAPPAPLRCYICGGQHLTERSLDMHVKACRRRFEQREAKRPAAERRPLLEEWELPDGAECLERLYELHGEPGPDDLNDAPASGIAWFGSPKGGMVAEASNAFEDFIGVRQGIHAAVPLLPCEFCKRTFAPERLLTHQKVCLQRPRGEAQPTRRRSGVTTPPPPAATRAYDAFCEKLARCPACKRNFRPELLQAHLKQCCPEGAGQREGLARSAAGGARGAHQPRRIPATRQQCSSGSRVARSPGHVSCSSPVSRRCRSAGSPSAHPSSPFSFGPATRSAAAAAGTSGGASGSSAAATSNDVSLQSSTALLAKGSLTEASSEEVGTLSAQLLERVPEAKFVNAFKVTQGPHAAVYDALKASMQIQLGELLAERVLWHGTSWVNVPKILRQGFNRSFAGRHGTLLGVATYFSIDPAYSHRFCDRRGGGQDGTKAMLLARVLVGSYCKGTSSDVEPPVRDAETGERFDSTVDNEEKPGIFAVFRDFQAVPLYLVEFRV